MASKGEDRKQDSRLDAVRVPWETGSPSLWSLYDMLKAYGHNLYFVANSLSRVALTQFGNEDAPVTDKTREGLRTIIIGVHAYAGELGLTATADRVARIAKAISQPLTAREIKIEIRHLNETLEDELKDKHFLRIPDAYVALYEHEHLFGEAVSRAFPSAADDIRSCGTALACGCHTASVFHAMRVTERLMRALAWDRRAVVKTKGKKGKEFPIDLATWEEIIKAVSDETGKITGWARTRGEVRTQAQEFYNSAMEEFRAIKDAWRNHIMHSRRSYLAEDAMQVAEHVKRLGQTLATRISESERTPRVWTKAQIL